MVNDKQRRFNSVNPSTSDISLPDGNSKSTQAGKGLVVSRSRPNFCIYCQARHSSLACPELDPATASAPPPSPTPPSPTPTPSTHPPADLDISMTELLLHQLEQGDDPLNVLTPDPTDRASNPSTSSTDTSATASVRNPSSSSDSSSTTSGRKRYRTVNEIDRFVSLYHEAVAYKLENPKASLRQCLSSVNFSKSSYYRCRYAIELWILDEEKYNELQERNHSLTDLDKMCKALIETSGTLRDLRAKKVDEGLILPF